MKPGRGLVAGAYGLRVTGLGAEDDLLARVPTDLPALHLAHSGGHRPFDASTAGDERVAFALGAGRGLLVERATARATFFAADAPTPADVVHPLLTAAAAAMARWVGYELFHAAAFVAGGRVWGVVGDRGSGKSTLAGWLARHGHPIVCDDMLATNAGRGFAGPRCVDLRPEPAGHLGVGRPVETGGPRARWRMRLPPLDGDLVLGGWVFLAWADVVDVVPLPPREVLRRLAQGRTWRPLPTDPVGLLDLAALPGWELRRPRGWASFDSAGVALESAFDAR